MSLYIKNHISHWSDADVDANIMRNGAPVGWFGYVIYFLNHTITLYDSLDIGNDIRSLYFKSMFVYQQQWTKT